MLISLITTGVDCGYSRVPGVSVRVAYFRKWLYDIGVDFTQHSDVLPQIRRQCEAGKALLSIGSGVAKCADCPERSYSYKGTGRYCYRCKGNLLRDTIRGDRCSCRRKVGYGLVDGSCVRCKEGTDSSFGHNRCLVELRP